MTRKTSKVVKASAGLALLTAAGFYLWPVPSSKSADAAPVAAIAEAEPTPVATPKLIAEPPQVAAVAPVENKDKDSVRAEKTRLAAEGEAVRIALREKRLDALDWAAPRPTPASAGVSEESKSERALPVEEKIQQTENVISRLKDRISKSQQQPSTKFDSTVLVARLQRRVTELEQRVQTLRDAPQPTQTSGNTPALPEAGPQGSAPEISQKAL